MKPKIIKDLGQELLDSEMRYVCDGKIDGHTLKCYLYYGILFGTYPDSKNWYFKDGGCWSRLDHHPEKFIELYVSSVHHILNNLNEGCELTSNSSFPSRYVSIDSNDDSQIVLSKNGATLVFTHHKYVGDIDIFSTRKVSRLLKKSVVKPKHIKQFIDDGWELQ
jgi:hypothetical protein